MSIDLFRLGKVRISEVSINQDKFKSGYVRKLNVSKSEELNVIWFRSG